MDMRFQWLKCRCAQALFTYLWAKGIKNWADYPSKHHLGKHHLLVRPGYVKDLAPTWQGNFFTFLRNRWHLSRHGVIPIIF
jgi:hypothetical protein